MKGITGTEAADRIARGKCVACGWRAPQPDSDSGFPSKLCRECQHAQAYDAARTKPAPDADSGQGGLF